MRKNSSYWYKLDNAAKIYPIVKSKSNSGTFKVSVSLNEIVSPEILQKSLDIVLPRFPMYKVQLKKGLFWFYLNYNSKQPIVKPETDVFCGHIDNSDYLFEVLYRNQTITLHVFHSLTDGAGAFMFLKSLVFEYLLLCGHKVTPDNMIITASSVISASEYEDSYVKYYDKSNRTAPKEEMAFKVKGEAFEFGGTGAINAWLKTSQIHALAKSKNATITAYLVGVLIYSIYLTQLKGKRLVKGSNKPVKVLIPVNLRNHFPSTTLRNFSGFIKACINMENKDFTFEEILTIVTAQMKESVKDAVFAKQANSYVYFEKNFFLRICPLFLKRLIIKLAYHFKGEGLNTAQFSNVGIVSFPKSVEPYIKNVSCAMGAYKDSTTNGMACSFKDEFNIMFSRSITERDIEREFFRFLTAQGIEILIESNFMEEQNEIL